jgi:hypothetical protein
MNDQSWWKKIKTTNIWRWREYNVAVEALSANQLSSNLNQVGNMLSLYLTKTLSCVKPRKRGSVWPLDRICGCWGSDFVLDRASRRNRRGRVWRKRRRHDRLGSYLTETLLRLPSRERGSVRLLDWNCGCQGLDLSWTGPASGAGGVERGGSGWGRGGAVQLREEENEVRPRL